MSFTIDKFDYLIVNTGYTARILRTEEDIDEVYPPHEFPEKNREETENLKEQINKFECSICKLRYPNGDCDSDSEGECSCMEGINRLLLQGKGCIFINDSLHGEGLYKIGDDSDHIAESLGKYDSGIICFKCPSLTTAMNLVDSLMKLDYCACFSHGNLLSLKMTEVNGKTILWMSYDCESG